MKRKFSVINVLLLIAFIASCSLSSDNRGNVKEKENSRAVIDAKNVETAFEIGEWGSTFNGSIVIKNTGTTTIGKWTLSFDWDYEITGSWGCEIVSNSNSRYTLKHISWNQNIEPGQSVIFGVSGNIVAPGPDVITAPTNDEVSTASGSSNPNPVLPEGPSGKLELAYKTITDSNANLEGILVIGNVNKEYYWNASMFDIRNITFETSSTVRTIKKNPWGQVEFTQEGDLVTINLKHLSYIAVDETYDFTISCDKKGSSPEPSNFKVSYMRGDEIRYPEIADLPASFEKNKASLSSSDLISNEADYYNSDISPATDGFIAYNPNHETQVQIGQVMSADYPINTENNVRIHMYSKNMAMGVALVYEFLKINPNYMVALGTKENMACGFLKTSNGHDRPVTIDGEQYYWNMKFPSDAPTPESNFHDGPYQQEPGNFADARIHMYDYLGPDAQHADIVSPNKEDNLNDPNFISATFSAGLSVTMTRELLYAICDYNGVDYNNFMDTAADKDAELKIVTYAYNRGYGMFLGKGIFGENIEEALATPDLVSSYDMGGFGAHVPTVNTVIKQMNSDLSDIYDAELTWDEIKVFLSQLRKFYTKGIPTDSEWDDMEEDVKKAFDVLKQHWGGETVSYRYDFLTLLRVAKKHLPETNPRPTGNAWFYNVQGAKIN